MDPDDFSTRTSLSWSARVVEAAGTVATYFGPETRVDRGWTGLYAVTPDHNPIVGETIPGFVNAVGFSGHGFRHAPATGQLVAELVADGEPALVDVSALTAARFEHGDELDAGTVID